jgi:hypothetical protein
MKGLRFPESFDVVERGDILGTQWVLREEEIYISVIGGGMLDDDGVTSFEVYDFFDMEDPQRCMTADDINTYLKDKYGA